jgi:flagellar biosynthesis/type III secretory pathway M-ring protein FliF/YscJ
MDVVIVLVVVALVVMFVSKPLRRPLAQEPGAAAAGEAGGAGRAERESERMELESELAELEAAREAKYREIRDAELDHRTGKLSEADYEAIDTALRGEAIEILRELDRAKERAAPAAPVPGPTA